MQDGETNTITGGLKNGLENINANHPLKIIRYKLTVFLETEWLKLLFLLADTQSWPDDIFLFFYYTSLTRQF